ncbi:hypothetical protein SRHO_G00175480 [Serrasalmus rhombeus]
MTTDSERAAEYVGAVLRQQLTGGSTGLMEEDTAVSAHDLQVHCAGKTSTKHGPPTPSEAREQPDAAFLLLLLSAQPFLTVF